MTHASDPRGVPQQPESPARRGVCGEPRGPLADRAKYSKHGGNLDHDGKPAQSQEPPRKQKQNREE